MGSTVRAVGAQSGWLLTRGMPLWQLMTHHWFHLVFSQNHVHQFLAVYPLLILVSSTLSWELCPLNLRIIQLYRYFYRYPNISNELIDISILRETHLPTARFFVVPRLFLPGDVDTFGQDHVHKWHCLVFTQVDTYDKWPIYWMCLAG